jgi:integrase
MKVKFSDKFLQSLCDPKPGKPSMLPPEGKRVNIWDEHTPGLGLRLNSKGAVSFFVMRRPVRARRKGEETANGGPKAKPVFLSLGTYPHVSLADARAGAAERLADLQKGIDPREAETEARRAKAAEETEQQKADEARKANLFAGVAETFIKRYVATKRTAGPIAQLVRRELVARWGAKPITDVGRGDVIAMIEEIGEESPSAAHQALIYARLLFDWAIERGTYGITASPCHPIKVARLIPDLPERRQRVLDDGELRLVWEAAWPPDATAEGIYPVGQFVRLLAVLGCRRGELAGMTWDEVDLGKAVWTLDGPRTKNGDPRIVPLPRLAVDILAAMPRFNGPHVFSTTYGKRPISGFAKIKQTLDRRIVKANGGNPIGGWRLHDLRRSMRTNLSALAILPLVAELMIGHRQRGVAAVYDLHAYEAEQRAGFEAWSNRLMSIVEPSDTGANIVPMPLGGRRP